MWSGTTTNRGRSLRNRLGNDINGRNLALDLHQSNSTPSTPEEDQRHVYMCLYTDGKPQRTLDSLDLTKIFVQFVLYTSKGGYTLRGSRPDTTVDSPTPVRDRHETLVSRQSSSWVSSRLDREPYPTPLLHGVHFTSDRRSPVVEKGQLRHTSESIHHTAGKIPVDRRPSIDGCTMNPSARSTIPPSSPGPSSLPTTIDDQVLCLDD